MKEATIVIINYILNNYVMIFELIGLLIMLRISAHISERMKRLTIAVIVLLLAEALLTKIEEYAGKGGAVYRVGGDEFVIFYINTSEGDIKANIDVMKIKVEKKGYVCAFGYSMKGKQESVDAVLSKADAKMYIDKEETKKKMLEKGITVHYRED